MWARIENFMHRTGKTWVQTAQTLGLTTAMLSMVKTGKRNLSKRAVFRLSEAERAAGILPPLQPVVADAATAHQAAPRGAARGIKKLIISAGPVAGGARPGRTCRLYGAAQCAQHGFRIGDVVPESEHDLPEVCVPDGLARLAKLAAFRAVDSSMEPRIREGDIIFIAPEAEVRQGDVVLVKFRDQVACKRFVRDGETAVLLSDSPDVPPLIVKGSDVDWAYRAVAVESLRKL